MKWVPTDHVPRTPGTEATTIVVLAGVTLALFVLVHQAGPYPTTMFYPPAGAVFAYLVLSGPTGIPAAAVVLTLGNAVTDPRAFGTDLLAELAQAILLAKILGLCAYPLHRVWRRRALRPRVFGVLSLFVVTGLLAAPIAAAAASFGLSTLLGGRLTLGDQARETLGLTTGVATIAPACLIGAVMALGRSPALLRRPLDGRREALVPATVILVAPLIALCLPGAGVEELWLLPLAAAPLFWISVTGDLVRSAGVLAISALVIGVLAGELFGEAPGLYRSQVMVLCCALATLYVAAACVLATSTRMLEEAATTRWRALVAAAPAMVVRVRADGTWRPENDRGPGDEEALPPSPRLPSAQRDEVRVAVRDRRPRTLHWHSIEPDGGQRHFVTRVTPLPDGETLVVTTGTTLAEAAEVTLAGERTHDRETGLPSRDLLVATAQRSLGEKPGTALILVVDLDQLTRRSLLLGGDGAAAVHSIADRVTAALEEGHGPGCLVARTGDDQLTVLVPEAGRLAPGVTERLLTAVATPVDVPVDMPIDMPVGMAVGMAVGMGGLMLGSGLPVHGSIGLATVTEAGGVADAVRQASMAAQAARERGETQVVVSDGVAIRTASARARLLAEVAGVVDRDELDVVYQPDVDPLRGRLFGVEALVRWRRPDGTAVATEDFVRMAEETGTVGVIDDWVMRSSIAQLGRWRREIGLDDVELGLNASVLSLTAALPGRLAAECERNAVPPRLVRLEVTETALGDDGRAIAVLRSARELGFRVAIDDFGTGYASLSRLRTLPVDVIKLDRSFLVSLTDDPATQTLVGMILGLAEPLQLDVVVEGVETRAQRDVLVELGCQRAQGFLFAAPTGPLELGRLMTDPEAFRR